MVFVFAIKNDLSASEFIKENYNIVHLHPEAALEDCNTYLLGECHQGHPLAESVRGINGLFISSYATPDSVLLVEAEEFLKPIPQEHVAITRSKLYIKTALVADLRGWDIENYGLKCTAPDIARKAVLSIAARSSLPSEDTSSTWLPIDWSVEMQKSLHPVKEVVSRGDCSQETFDMLETVFKDTARLLTDYDHQHIIPLHKNLTDFDKEGTDLNMDISDRKLCRLYGF